MNDHVEIPQNIQAEQSVLGAIFLGKEAMNKVADMLTAGDFYKPAHQRIFRTMQDLHEQGEPADLVTVTAELQDRKLLDEVGGVSYLTGLAGAVPTAANIEYYAKIVIEKSLRRQIMALGSQLVNKGSNSEEEVMILMNEAQKRLVALEQSQVSDKGFRSMREVAESSYERIEFASQNKGRTTGIPSGYPDLDKMTAGFQRSDFIVLAARPSVGKTALALNIAQNVAIRANETVAIFSLEMKDHQLFTRMLCAEVNLDASHVRTGYLDADDWQKVTMGMDVLTKAPIFIDDSSDVTVSTILKKCRKLQQEHGLGLILIDYLQLMSGRGNNRQEEISDISRGLKAVARELNVPVIALSQLSRKVEERADKRPMMSDIRESGSIEQDADVIAFLYRDDYYNKESENKNIVEIIIGKQRNGPTGTVELAFLKEYNKFVSLDNRFGDQQQMSLQPSANG